MANNPGKQDVAGWLIEEWTAKLASSIETMTERRPGVSAGSPIPLSAPEIPQEALWHSIPLTLASDAAFFVGATAESWLHIGKSALLAAGIPDSSEEDARGTYLEILTQTTSAAVQSLAVRLEQIDHMPARERSDALGPQRARRPHSRRDHAERASRWPRLPGLEPRPGTAVICAEGCRAGCTPPSPKRRCSSTCSRSPGRSIC